MPDWCFLSGMVGNADGGVPEERYFLVPRRQITIVPTFGIRLDCMATGATT